MVFGSCQVSPYKFYFKLTLFVPFEIHLFFYYSYLPLFHDNYNIIFKCIFQDLYNY